MSDTGNTQDIVSAAHALKPVLADRAAETDEARRLPADLAKTIAETGLFRMVIPSAYGGLQSTPRQILETIETVSQANASAGWCVMIGATTALNAAYMDPVLPKRFTAPHTQLQAASSRRWVKRLSMAMILPACPAGCPMRA